MRVGVCACIWACGSGPARAYVCVWACGCACVRVCLGLWLREWLRMYLDLWLCVWLRVRLYLGLWVCIRGSVGVQGLHAEARPTSDLCSPLSSIVQSCDGPQE